MAPVLVDTESEVAVQGRDLSKGVPLNLSVEQRSQVVLTKYINMNQQKADWQPAGEWHEQVITDVGRGKNPRITVKREDGEERPVSIDDGLIIDLVGKMTGVVGMLPGQPPMSEAQVQAYMDASGEPVPLYQQWDFRVTRILKTNGPELRLQLTKTEDQKRQMAQTEMFDAFTRMFQLGAEEMAKRGDKSPAAAAVLQAGIAAAGSKKA